MDNALDLFLSTGTLILASGIVILTFFIRRIVETAIPSAKKQADENEVGITYATPFAHWWNSVILYAVPVLVGGSIGFLDIPFLFQNVDLSTAGGRAFFGAVTGWFSSFMYKVARKILIKKTGVDLNALPEEPLG